MISSMLRNTQQEVSFSWGEQQQHAYKKIKGILASFMTMTMPNQGKPMMLCLTTTPYSISALLIQEVEEQEQLVYYLSRCLHGVN
ncbi:Uncharacterized protein TCM_027459 [Theobroma cacao]|uniref:Reverse transcriptase/retrotransposon-derived protein RNase H-like domain-containing protein n=1 Tax=Theobroma cacao TaxID=3641 RepID=A0A061GA88_THECC|nr:Uncharacterized protein TCM_027459 [Theobroma cacao]